MARALEGRITRSSELVAVKKNSDSTYALSFKQGASTKTVASDKVVLALPFSILRSSVDLSRAGFSKLKMTAIREQGMGTNSKLHAQFSDRYWSSLDSNGDTFADTGYQNTWDVTRAQPGQSGILVDYTRAATSVRASAPGPPRAARSSSSVSSNPSCPAFRPAGMAAPL